MFALLGWLWSSASRVYFIFGPAYGLIVDAAYQARSWAKSAFNRAVKKARGLIIQVEIKLGILVDVVVAGAVSAVLGIAQSLFKLALGLIDKVDTELHIKINGIQKRLDLRLNQLSIKVGLIIERTLPEFIITINGIIKRIKVRLNQLEIKWGLLSKLVDVFTDSAIAKFLDFINRMYYFLDAFMRAPLAFIMNMLRSVFLNFLEYLLGYALQGPKHKLPPWPSWDEMEGQPGPGPSPPPGTGKLGAPVTPLWISGYTYNNPPGHRGIDLGLARNQSVRASHDGVIRAAGNDPDGYGFFIVLDSQTWWTRYGHLSQFNVSLNSRVDKGQVIGLGDSTGRSTGDHLHFEAKYRGSFVDPVTVLPI